jgi:hypothetical protein
MFNLITDLADWLLLQYSLFEFTVLLILLCKSKHPCAQHESIWGKRGIFHSFSSLAECVCEWSALCCSCLTPKAVLPVSNVIGSFVGPTASLGVWVKQKFFWPCWKLCFLQGLVNKKFF